ncbi:hypothetical protein [Thiomicrorhabdus xiamenensis]|uniref:Uncharacterized protein n=1 Tax=Thiomicrorhabdus xiamenensis TaxID=2739063 RepID=A0A7D4NQD0_9GAMM|nr:hypothetical protein [Thiomicrorhabdus xiamenensis]QKI88570.1 hypothetical protein HQN79_02770 [Thiomicrorhabdus xiamenensis]
MALDFLNAGKTESSDAIFSLVNILNTKAVTGYDQATPSDDTTNIMDIIGAVKALPAGDTLISTLHQIAPGPVLIDNTVALLKTLPAFSALLPVLAPNTTEGELGGDALGAVVGHLKAIPALEGPVTGVITALHEGPLGDQVGMVTGLLHDISLGGNAIGGNIPAGTLFASESTGDLADPDSLDVVVGFAKGLPLVGDVVDMVIPDIFPNAGGENMVAAAGILHHVFPAYNATNALLGEDGMISGALGGLTGGDMGGVLDIAGLLDLGGNDLLDGLLGGLDFGGSASGSASADGSGDASLTGSVMNLLSLGSDSALDLGGLLSF